MMVDKEMVLVTGGTGYVGSWCIIELLRQGYRVRTTVRDRGRSGELRTAMAREVQHIEHFEIIKADLESDEAWPEAVKDCRYVLHIASPFPPKQPKDAEQLIRPAREGTLRVLKACLEANVERVVLTSSSSAMAYPTGETPELVTEEYWTDPDHPSATPYVKSKVWAEAAAWEFVAHNERSDLLTVIAPSTILGPVLNKDFSYSLRSVACLLDGSVPAIPRLGFAFVDVRDVAELHLRAMTTPAAGGQRYLASGEFHWLEEVAAILRSSLGAEGKRVPRYRAPDFMVKLLAKFNPELRSVIKELGQRRVFSSEKARQMFGWSPRPFQETVVDCATSLIWAGAI
jgi:dihydroflavonol-4-reductase